MQQQTTNHTRLHKILSLPMIVLFVVASITAYFGPQVRAADCDYDFYSLQDISFYDPCGGSTCSAGSGSLTGPAPTSLSGSTNQEKAWNYFTGRGLTPVAAAGAMGNIEAESSFSASVEEASGGGGLGIIQWTGSRRTDLESAAAAAGVNLADNDSALLFELNYLWDGEYKAMIWQEQVNAETTVEGDTTKASFWGRFNDQRIDPQTGNGSTMVFHALIERSGDVPTEADRISGHGVLTHRIDNAKKFLEQFGGGSGAGAGCSNVSAEGLTFEQASTLAKKLVDDWGTIFCGSDSVKAGKYCSWNEGYCTAGAAWMAETTAPDPTKVPGIPNGVDVANTLISSNSSVYTSGNADGSNLQPFSVWSFGAGSAGGQPGHTGTIVGVGKDGSIVTVEVNWAGETAGATKSYLYSAGHRAAAFQYPSFDAFKASRGSYVFNAVATPKDASVATEMGNKIKAFMGN